MNIIALELLQIFLILLLSPLLVGIVRTLKARLNQRKGPPLLQPYRNLLRLIRKDTAMAENASWIFRVAPYLIFASTWVAAVIVPTFTTVLPFSAAADLIALVALLATARFMLALAGMDIGTSFGGLGASREMMIGTLAEPAMLTVTLAMALLSGSTSMPAIVTHFLTHFPGISISIALALISLLLVAVAENARIPVDNPATHLELTMVHEAMVLEYSGRHLAMIEGASMLKLGLYFALISGLFFPWGMTTAIDNPAAIAAALGIFVFKMLVCAIVLAISETAVAKMRVFRVAEFLGVGLLFGFLGVIFLYIAQVL